MYLYVAEMRPWPARKSCPVKQQPVIPMLRPNNKAPASVARNGMGEDGIVMYPYSDKT